MKVTFNCHKTLTNYRAFNFGTLNALNNRQFKIRDIHKENAIKVTKLKISAQATTVTGLPTF